MVEKKQKSSARSTPTSLDVARRAGVSRTAVSYVLNDNGKRNFHVSEENRAKILQAAQELGYIPHASARTLRKGLSEEICVLIDIPLSVYRSELFTSIQQYAFQQGYSPVGYFSPGLPLDQVRELLLKIFARRPMGLFASGYCMTEENIALAKQMGVDNIVLYADRPLKYAHTIVIPTEAIGYLAAQHLYERGHRHLAIVMPDDPLLQHGYDQRVKGMRAALAEREGCTLDILPLRYTLADAYVLVDTYFMGKDHPTGVYGFNDEYALLLLGAMLDRGIRVPHDIALIGTDDISFGSFMRPTLTTIRFDARPIEERAISMLVAMHKGQPLSDEYSRPLVPQLVLREST